MGSGRFLNVEDVLLDALQPDMGERQQLLDGASGKSLVEIGDRVRGMAEDCDFSRSRSAGRPVIRFDE